METSMHVLFIHRDFPGQFRYVAPRLAAQGWTCTFVTRNGRTPELPGVRRITYDLSASPADGCHPLARGFGNSLGHALGVYDAIKAQGDVRPDLVVAHGSFGSS